MYVCMYVCRNRGRVFYFTLSYGISSRLVVSSFISACSAQSFSSFSHRVKHVRSPQCSLLFKWRACPSCPWCKRLPTSRSFIRNFFCTNRSHETSESAQQNRILLKTLLRVRKWTLYSGLCICGFNNIRINVDEAFSLTWTAVTYIYWNKKQVGVVGDTNMRWCDVI